MLFNQAVDHQFTDVVKQSRRKCRLTQLRSEFRGDQAPGEGSCHRMLPELIGWNSIAANVAAEEARGSADDCNVPDLLVPQKTHRNFEAGYPLFYSVVGRIDELKHFRGDALIERDAMD